MLYLPEAIKYGHDRVVQCLVRHGASWAEDGAGDLLYAAVGKSSVRRDNQYSVNYGQGKRHECVCL